MESKHVRGKRWTGTTLGLMGVVLILAGCGGRMPRDLGARNGRLADCPNSPNCVSSFARDKQHGIEALEVVGDPEAAWTALRAVLEGMPRMEIVGSAPGYLHAVQTSRLMRYRDDLELLLDAPASRIHVRSASRVGYGDMGVNRARVEAIRAAMAERGFVRN
jgi:uncharacterized protein (DUF1499 family)